MNSTQEMPTPDTPQLLLEHHLKALRLPTILSEYDKMARQCAAERVDYPRYLLRLTELEFLDRDRRAVERCRAWSCDHQHGNWCHSPHAQEGEAVESDRR